jgi:hypothetical protein
MFDNMTGAVGFAMHEDRLAQAERNQRLLEAEATAKGQRRHAGAAYRVVLAQCLIALAARIAPTVTLPTMRTRAVAQ